uniref:Gag-Pol polyprotein n=1 Tax=Tanacetum cinerariifolium TaxID=118510 RepID=A0A699K487_TANCI|nr:hypothetical protein [Tanacetum cinerariifolium]
MHNDIMAAGFEDRSPTLATGRYAQWQSLFMRYVDMKPNMQDLKNCILNGPYQLHPEWSRFVTVVKQTVGLDKESYHKLFDTLKQYQNEVNEIHAEKIARNANPLALVAAAQHYLNDNYYHAPKPHKHQTISSRHTSSTNSHAPTRNKGKEIAKPRTPLSLSASDDDSD